MRLTACAYPHSVAQASRATYKNEGAIVTIEPHFLSQNQQIELLASRSEQRSCTPHNTLCFTLYFAAVYRTLPDSRPFYRHRHHPARCRCRSGWLATQSMPSPPLLQEQIKSYFEPAPVKQAAYVQQFISGSISGSISASESIIVQNIYYRHRHEIVGRICTQP